MKSFLVWGTGFGFRTSGFGASCLGPPGVVVLRGVVANGCSKKSLVSVGSARFR